MRRNSVAIFLFALALFGRLLVPMAAQAYVADPLAGAPICEHSDGSTSDGNSANHDSTHHEACAFACCQIAPALAGFDTRVLVVREHYARAEWQNFIAATPPLRAVAANRARGPPKLS